MIAFDHNRRGSCIKQLVRLVWDFEPRAWLCPCQHQCQVYPMRGRAHCLISISEVVRYRGAYARWQLYISKDYLLELARWRLRRSQPNSSESPIHGRSGNLCVWFLTLEAGLQHKHYQLADVHVGIYTFCWCKHAKSHQIVAWNYIFAGIFMTSDRSDSISSVRGKG